MLPFNASARRGAMMRERKSVEPPGGAGVIKRRFGEDTVFSRTYAAEPEQKKRFINDVIRSDFHRAFLRKFVT